MLLPPGIPTLEAYRTKNLTRPDNVFASESLVDCLIRCEVTPQLRPPKTDHFPITTVLRLAVARVPIHVFRNFRQVEWVAFRTALALRLEDLSDPAQPIRTTAEFDDRLCGLMDALQDTICETVPETKLPPFVKRWYSKELDNMRREVNRTRRKAYRLRESPHHPVHADYRRLHNQY
ncbi:hypothetical protein FOMPIDRAFT_1098982, partial [Fomitopsis schrenkii]